MKENCTTPKLSIVGLGVAFGAVWALSLFMLSMLGTYFDFDSQLVEDMGNYYEGYGLGLVPALIGSALGFLDAGIGGAMIALVYNGVVKLMQKKCCKKH